jgi:predicted RNA-binding Zn ribbon-like protein
MVEIEIVGNALCLDLANTVNARPVAQWDVLATPDAAVAWSGAVGHPVDDSPAGDEGELAAIRALRELIYRVFGSLAHGRPPAEDDLDALAAEYSVAVANGSLRNVDGTYRLSWPEPRTLQQLRWEVVVSSMDLLTQGRLDRLGECPSCGWLFLDTSKNRRRRWCSMATCGSRDKARRYYARQTT